MGNSAFKINPDSDYTKIVSGTTKVDTADTSGEVVMDVGGTEAFRLHDNGVLELPKQSRVRAYSAGDQNVGTGSQTTIVLGTEDYDNLSEFSSNVFTATEAGYYLVCAQVTIDPTVDGSYYILYLRHEDTTDIRRAIGVPGGTGGLSLNISDVVYLAAGEDLRIELIHNEGDDAVVKAGTDDTYMSVHKLS